MVLLLLPALAGGGFFAARAFASRTPALELVPAAAPAPLDALERWQRQARVLAPKIQAEADAARAARAERHAKRRARLAAITKLPERYLDGKLIEVSVAQQRLRAWEDGKVQRTFRISSGKPGYETPEGHFSVGAKARNGWSRKWEVVMPWMLQFKGNYTIHQVTHKRNSSDLIGRHLLGNPASHGCVRVDVGDAEWLYHWAPVGTPVWIH